MSHRSVRIIPSSGVALALGILLTGASLGHAQMHRPALRGTPGGMGMGGFPGLPGIPLVNNGTLQISRNPNPTFPNATPFAYIAALPLGDRLPYNGILADPQMTPQTQVGQQLQQNILLNLQQQQFGPNANPFNLQSQAFRQPQLGPLGNPIGTPFPGFVGWGAARPDYGFGQGAAMSNFYLMNMLANGNGTWGMNNGLNPYGGQAGGFDMTGTPYDPTGLFGNPTTVNLNGFGNGFVRFGGGF